jgi:hypothetical protein
MWKYDILILIHRTLPDSWWRVVEISNEIHTTTCKPPLDTRLVIALPGVLWWSDHLGAKAFQLANFGRDGREAKCSSCNPGAICPLSKLLGLHELDAHLHSEPRYEHRAGRSKEKCKKHGTETCSQHLQSRRSILVLESLFNFQVCNSLQNHSLPGYTRVTFSSGMLPAAFVPPNGRRVARRMVAAASA